MNEWIGKIPECCDICQTKIEDVFVDGKIEGCNAWGIMCPFCALSLGINLGKGNGQLYAKNVDSFVKIREWGNQ